jgi:cobalt-zinc-cadmium efflux system outer membrane protein
LNATFLRWSIHIFVLLIAASGAVGQSTQGGVDRPLGREFPTYIAAGAPDSLVEPTGELRLPEALALALLHNPRLATFSWDLRATEAARLQAGAWPNPEIAFEYENFAGGGVFQGVDAAEATLALSQLVLLGGKRGKRTEVARLDERLSSWDYEIVRIQTHAAVVAAFVKVLAAQEQLALAEKIVEIAQGIQGAVAVRVRAGGTLELEENRARVAGETSLIEEELARRRLTIARRELVAMWGSSGPRFTRATGGMEAVVGEVPSLDALLAQVDKNPDVARWTTELERRRASVGLIKADRIPDINVGFGVRHHSADDAVALVLGVSAPLPMWDRKSGAIREAEAMTEQAKYARRAMATDVRRDIAVAYEVMAGAHEEVTRLPLPRVREMLTALARFNSRTCSTFNARSIDCASAM